MQTRHNLKVTPFSYHDLDRLGSQVAKQTPKHQKLAPIAPTSPLKALYPHEYITMPIGELVKISSIDRVI